jgi:thiamine pyrophosphate-dependent acetolactate synthase large subunit-like protein
MGTFSIRVNHSDQVSPALEGALNQDKLAVIEFRVQDLVPTSNYP